MGTKAGAAKARATILARDPEWFSKIGSMGGRAGVGHQFAHGKVKPGDIGKKGGKIGKRDYEKEHAKKRGAYETCYCEACKSKNSKTSKT